MLIGGIVSKASGGSFERGAVTAGVVFLYNDLSMAQSFKKLWNKIVNGDIANDVKVATSRGYSEGVKGVWHKKGEIVSNINRAIYNAHPAAKGCLAFAGAVTIAPFAEAGYTYAMTHPEQIMIPIDLAIGYFDGNPPDVTSGWQSIGAIISNREKVFDLLLPESWRYKNYDPYWLEKSAIFNYGTIGD